MDESKRKALLAYRPQLIRCLIIEHFIADLHECAGGVLNDVEEDAIVSKENNRAKVYEFFRILLTKGNDAFEKFCLVMESDPSHKEWAEKLRHKASENELARECSFVTEQCIILIGCTVELLIRACKNAFLPSFSTVIRMSHKYFCSLQYA